MVTEEGKPKPCHCNSWTLAHNDFSQNFICEKFLKMLFVPIQCTNNKLNAEKCFEGPNINFSYQLYFQMPCRLFPPS